MTETHIDGLVVIKHEEKEAICYEHCMGSVPKFASPLRRGPAQDVTYDLILWYLSKNIYL